MTTSCYHCNEPVPAGLNLSVNIDGQSREMCCIGCQAVAQTIVDNGLTQYYQFRTEPAQKGQALVPEELTKKKLLDDEALQSEFTHGSDSQKETILTIDGISCAACAWLIEMQISKLKGVLKIQVNATSQRATVVWNNEITQLSDVLAGIEKIGYHALPFKANVAEEISQAQSKAFIRRLGISGILMMQVMMIAVGLYFGAFSDMSELNQLYLRWTSFILATPIILYGAFPFYIGAYKAIKAKRLSMDVPVSIAILLAFSASGYATITQQGEVYFESVSMFTFLLLIGKFLEFRARSRAAQLSANLLKLMPLTATRLTSDGESLIPAKKLVKLDKIIIKPGETIPADGIILSGKSQLNEAMLTGEQLPINKTVGETVFAGTINGDSNLTVEVSKESNNSFLSQLIRLSEHSQHHKPKLAKLSDQIAQYFVALILVTATGSAIFWMQHEPSEAFWITLSILVATCPCALSLATPTALTCATTRLNRDGIMIKSGHVLESLPQIDSFAFDKTGTLTHGHFSLSHVEIVDADYSKEQILAIAAGLEAYSEHPLAKAFVPYRDYRIQISDVNVMPSRGIQGKHDNKALAIGKSSWLIDDSYQGKFDTAQCALVIDEKLVAVFYLEDELREDTKDLLTILSSKDYQLMLLSGDNKAGCDKISANLPLDVIRSGLSAQDKMDIIKSQKDKTVAMVGDGVNDTPVFAAAHISIAMGSGTDIAKNGADVILLNNKLSTIKECLSVGIKTKRIIWQNYGWAMGYNAIVLPLAVMGYITPYLAVIGMSLSSILVVTNSLRLLKK